MKKTILLIFCVLILSSITHSSEAETRQGPRRAPGMSDRENQITPPPKNQKIKKLNWQILSLNTIQKMISLKMLKK